MSLSHVSSEAQASTSGNLLKTATVLFRRQPPTAIARHFHSRLVTRTQLINSKTRSPTILLCRAVAIHSWLDANTEDVTPFRRFVQQFVCSRRINRWTEQEPLALAPDVLEGDSRMSVRGDDASVGACAESTMPDGLGFLRGLVELGAAEVAIDVATNGLGPLMQRVERLGGGTFGNVHKVPYDGQEYAVKEAKDNPAVSGLPTKRSGRNGLVHFEERSAGMIGVTLVR